MADRIAGATDPNRFHHSGIAELTYAQRAIKQLQQQSKADCSAFIVTSLSQVTALECSCRRRSSTSLVSRHDFIMTKEIILNFLLFYAQFAADCKHGQQMMMLRLRLYQDKV